MVDVIKSALLLNAVLPHTHNAKLIDDACRDKGNMICYFDVLIVVLLSRLTIVNFADVYMIFNDTVINYLYYVMFL